MANDGLGYAGGAAPPMFQLLSAPTPSDAAANPHDAGRGTTSFTYEETGLPVGPGPQQSDTAANQPATTVAPMSIWDFLTQPVVFGIPLYGMIAIAAAAGLGYYMFIYSAGKKR